MLLKRCMQYASKFGKLSSGHRTGKGQFSFQSQRKVMAKNVQITIWMHSFHMLARLCSKSFKLGFSSTWTENFQMYKMDLEKADEPEIKLPTSVCWIIEKAREFPKNTYFCFIDYTEAFVWITTNCGIFLKRWEYKTTLPASCMQDKKQVRIGHETMDWFQTGKGVYQGCVLSPCLFNLYAEYIMRNAGTGRNTSWNQDCWEKYQ